MTMKPAAKRALCLSIAVLIFIGAGLGTWWYTSRGPAPAPVQAAEPSPSPQPAATQEPGTDLAPAYVAEIDMNDQEEAMRRFDAVPKDDPVVYGRTYDLAVDLSIADGPGRPKSREAKQLANAEAVAKQERLFLAQELEQAEREANAALPSGVRVAYAMAGTNAGAAAGPAMYEQPVMYAEADNRITSIIKTAFLSQALPRVTNLTPRLSVPRLPPPAPTPATLAIETPAVGEEYTVGQTLNVVWTNSHGRAQAMTYALSVSRDGGTTYTDIARDIQGLSYAWTITGRPAPQCLLKLEAYVAQNLLETALSDPFALIPLPPPVVATPTPAPTSTPKPTPTPPPFVPSPTLGYAKAGSFFIARDMGTRWMNAEILKPGVARLVWQVSRAPFSGLNEDALEPAGLLASGELDVQNGEFAVDFSHIVSSVLKGAVATATALDKEAALCRLQSGAVLVPQTRYSLHVRVIAVNALGQLVGDAGEGQDITYGDWLGAEMLGRDFQFPYLDGPLVKVLDRITEKPSHSTYEATFIHQPKGLDITPAKPYVLVDFAPYYDNTYRVVAQVSSSPYPEGLDEETLRHPPGLIYEFRGVAYGESFQFVPFETQMNVFHPETVAQYLPDIETLGDNVLKYYVRAIFYQTTDDPAVYTPAVSEVQVLNYRAHSYTETLKEPVRLEMGAYIGYAVLQSYTPIRWPDPNAKNIFEVTRPIKYDEFNLTLTTPDMKIYPYAEHKLHGNQNMTPEQYEALLMKYLPPGATFTYAEKSAPWYEEFITELWMLMTSFYEQIRQGYDDLKNLLVDLVVSIIPSGKVRDVLRTAVMAAFNYGLSCIGLPPSLPSFEKLAKDGFDYVYNQAIDEACEQLGISPDAIPDDLKKQISDEVHEGIDKLSRAASPNPWNADFLRLSTKHCYKPAVLEVYVKSPYSEKENVITPRGTLSFFYRATSNSIMEYYKSVSLPIPRMQAQEEMVITVYLEQDLQDWNHTSLDYKTFYFGKQDRGNHMYLLVEYDVPDPKTAYDQQVKEGRIKEDERLKYPKGQVFEYVYRNAYRFSYATTNPPCEPLGRTVLKEIKDAP